MFPRKFQHQNIWKKLFFKAKGFEIKTEKTYVSIYSVFPLICGSKKKRKRREKKMNEQFYFSFGSLKLCMYWVLV